MTTPWHPTQPIEQLFKQLKDGITLAKVGKLEISDSQVVCYGYGILEATGVFERALYDWRNKPEDIQTFAFFQVFFKIAYTDRPATTKQAGYHSSNNVSNADLQKQITALQQKMAATSPRPTRPPVITSTGATPNVICFPGYCHTHGHTHATTLAKVHTSMTCKKPSTNHKSNTTANNQMGGTTRDWSQNNSN
jgi:hypothetical protein